MLRSAARQHRQRGIATLAISLVIISIAAVVTINTSKAVLFEQKTSANQYWAILAHEAAQAGLEEALAWAQSMDRPDPMPAACPSPVNPHVLACWTEDTSAWSSSPTDLTLSERRSAGALVPGFDTRVHFQRETQPLAALNVVEVIAEATSRADPTIRAQVRQRLYLPTISVNTSGAGAAHAPLLLNGCFYPAKGSPEIYPGGTGTPNLALATLYSVALCPDWDHMRPNGGATRVDLPAPSAWATLFPGMSQGQMKAISDLQAAQGLDDASSPRRTVYWVDSSSNWHQSLGSETEPVIVVFSDTACASGCPKLNGHPIIYGIVYFDTDVNNNLVQDEASEVELANGWGGLELYGTLAIEGGVRKVNANSEFHYHAGVNSALDIPAPPAGLTKAARVPGSWRDY